MIINILSIIIYIWIDKYSHKPMEKKFKYDRKKKKYNTSEMPEDLHTTTLDGGAHAN